MKNTALGKALGTIWIIARKDLVVELRSKQAFLTTLFFAVLILLIFNFAFPTGSQATREAGAGILWVALLFPGVIQLNRSFQSETEEGTLYGLILAPLDRGLLFLGKCLANWIFLFCIDLFVLVLFLVFFNFSFGWHVLWLLLLLLLVSIGFTGVGTVFAAMLASLRARDVMLPVLLFPVIVPIILAGVNAAQEVLMGGDQEFFRYWVNLLVAFDVIFLSAGYLLFEYVVGE